ncbi:MAG: DNA ligase D [Pseudomonadota bacterium]
MRRAYFKKLTGGWMLKKLPDGEKPWLLIKERDPGVVKGFEIKPPRHKRPRKTDPAGEESALPKRMKPQLPSRVDSPPEGPDWLHEIKFDGYRTLAIKSGDQVRFITRQGLDWTERYAALIPHFQALDCDTALIDGEVAAQDGRGATSLELLQAALSENRDFDLVFYAFDLVHLNARDLAGVPLIERKTLLRRLVPFEPTCRIQFSDHVEGGGRALFSQVCRLGLEGVVSKRRDAPYRQERTTSWVKAKRFDVAQFDVIGYTTKSSTRHIASLILAEDGVYAGRAGTGLSLDETHEWFDRLSAVEIAKPDIEVPKTPNAHFVGQGQFTAEISYRGRTTKNVIRHAAILSVTETTAAPARPAAKRLITDRDLASIRLTNPDREMFEGSGTTKLDIALYYARVGDWMLPHLMNRPVTLIRCSTGKEKDCFYQRHGFSGLPDGVETMGDTRDEEFLVIRSAQGFLGLPQFGTLEFHPWDCTVDDLDHPDRMTIDLDPGDDVDWATVISAAGMIRDRLTTIGLTGFVRMTGGTGLHLVVPLIRSAGWDVAAAFLKGLATSLAKDHPKLFTDNIQKANRHGRIYVDVNRTRFGTSAVASYSLRARAGFPAALPLMWQDLSAATQPSEFHRKNAVLAVEKMARDPWIDFDDARTELTGRMVQSVGAKG